MATDWEKLLDGIWEVFTGGESQSDYTLISED